jgi:very-short-patch-repair endonuclease
MNSTKQQTSKQKLDLVDLSQKYGNSEDNSIIKKARNKQKYSKKQNGDNKNKNNIPVVKQDNIPIEKQDNISVVKQDNIPVVKQDDNDKILKNKIIKEIPFEKSFAAHPMSLYWSKINTKSPSEYFLMSNVKCHFDCNNCGHTFESRLALISRGNKCPYCASKKLCTDLNCDKCEQKSFASHPYSEFWCIELNKGMPRDYFKSSEIVCYFKCTCEHIFKSSLANISRGQKCPYCASKQLCDNINCVKCEEKSFSSHPYSKFWSKEKNKGVPRDYFKSSNHKFYFDCNCGHTFECTLNHIKDGKGCPYCVSQKLCDSENCNQCEQKSFASISYSKSWAEKNIGTPRNYFKGSTNICLFNCECGNVFECEISYISQGYDKCPCCAVKQLCNDMNCVICQKKTFANNPYSKFWSYDRNKGTPQDYFKSTIQRFYFNCECGHTFQTSLNEITKGGWCPYCASVQLCDDKNCNQCWERSFISHDKSIFWNKTQNKGTPRNYFKFSIMKCYFDCKCGHTFLCRLSQISNGIWCPYCAHTQLCANENCKSCLENSFMLHDKSKYWSTKNILSPRQVFKNSDMKYIFDCPNCNNDYITSVCTVTKGSWCSCTNNKTETKMYEHLQQTYNTLIEKEKKFDWCKNTTHLPFDFCMEQHKLIIELDGQQHFEQVSTWTPPEQIQKKDKFKMDCANTNNYSMIRLLQRDVWDDKNNWQTLLDQAIQTIIRSSGIQNIFIGDVYKTVDTYKSLYVKYL